MTQKFSVIIPTFDRPFELTKVIKSIEVQTVPPLELIVVDGSEADETSELVAEFEKRGGGIRFLHLKTDPHLTRQRNLGVARSSGDFICFLDDDVILDPQYLERICEVFHADVDMRVGGVGGVITNQSYHGTLAKAGIERLFGLGIPNSVSRLGHNTTFCETSSTPFRVEWLPGGNAVYRRRVFLTHGFEESLTTYALYEDAVFSYGVSKEWLLLVQPQARMMHFPSTANRLSAFEFNRMRVQNQYYFFKNEIDCKTIKDYFRLALFFFYLVALHVGVFLRRPSWKTAEGISGVIAGLVDLIFLKYPKRSRTVLGVIT